MKTKSISGLKIEDEDKGLVSAVFSRFNVIDHDGDVTLPGAFTDGQKVRISAYNHASWNGALPVGKGEIRTTEEHAILDGQFFLETVAGRDTFKVVQQMGELQEWSYGFDVLEGESGTWDGEDVHLLRSLKVHEVSPVILGAGIGTHTLAVKGAKQLQSDLFRALRDAGRERFGGEDTWVFADDFDVDDSFVVYHVETEESARLLRVEFSRSSDGGITLADGEEEVEQRTSYAPKSAKNLKLSEHIDAVLTDVEKLTERTADVMAKRSEKGKGLGEESKELLERLQPALKTLGEALAPPEPDTSAEDGLLREIARDEHRRFTTS